MADVPLTPPETAAYDQNTADADRAINQAIKYYVDASTDRGRTFGLMLTSGMLLKSAEIDREGMAMLLARAVQRLAGKS